MAIRESYVETTLKANPSSLAPPPHPRLERRFETVAVVCRFESILLLDQTRDYQKTGIPV